MKCGPGEPGRSGHDHGADRAAALDALRADLTDLESLPHDRRSDASSLAAAAAQRAIALGVVDLELRAQLVQADAIARKGRTAASARILRNVNRWAAEHSHTYLLARSHRHLAALVRTIGDYPTSLEHAIRAVELIDDDTPPHVRIDHQIMLAIALARTGDFDAAAVRFATAERETIALGNDALHVMLLNNVAYMHHQAGRPVEALAAARRMNALCVEHGMPPIATYVDTLGRTLLAAGQPAEAVRVIKESLSSEAELSEPDGVADCMLTLAEAQRALGDLDQAHRTLDECVRLCAARQLAEVRLRVHHERAELFAAQERFREAFDEYKRYSAASAELFSNERDGRAKVVQAVFEAAEARRDSERFRRLSLHDPLTSLYNRRFVDERLPDLVVTAERLGTALSVALIDLDHFKRINDTCSHETGDAVLVAVASVFEQGVPGSGFVARLGGEEFLLVLPGLDEAAAVTLCEDLRQQLHRYDWRTITGPLPVTASFGVAAAGVANTQLTLLRRADANLYQAKRAGRDRIISGEPGAAHDSGRSTPAD